MDCPKTFLTFLVKLLSFGNSNSTFVNRQSKKILVKFNFIKHFFEASFNNKSEGQDKKHLHNPIFYHLRFFILPRKRPLAFMTKSLN